MCCKSESRHSNERIADRPCLACDLLRRGPDRLCSEALATMSQKAFLWGVASVYALLIVLSFVPVAK